MPRRPSQEKQTRHTRTPLPPSALDELEAMVRCLEFQRLLPLWRGIFTKNYGGLTAEEERERDAPRTKVRLAAIAEADSEWLSQSIQQIRKHGETAWATETIRGPWGDTTNAIHLNTLVPADRPPDEVARVLARDIRTQRQPLGIVATQHPCSHEVDKWRVYDLRKQGLTLATITRRLFNLKGKINYDRAAEAAYAQVRRAYESACVLIHTLAE